MYHWFLTYSRGGSRGFQEDRNEILEWRLTPMHTDKMCCNKEVLVWLFTSNYGAMKIFMSFNIGIKMKSWSGGLPQPITCRYRNFRAQYRDRNEILVWMLTSTHSAVPSFKRFKTGIEMKSWHGCSPPPIGHIRHEFQGVQHRNNNEVLVLAFHFDGVHIQVQQVLLDLITFKKCAEVRILLGTLEVVVLFSTSTSISCTDVRLQDRHNNGFLNFKSFNTCLRKIPGMATYLHPLGVFVWNFKRNFKKDRNEMLVWQLTSAYTAVKISRGSTRVNKEVLVWLSTSNYGAIKIFKRNFRGEWGFESSLGHSESHNNRVLVWQLTLAYNLLVWKLQRDRNESPGMAASLQPLSVHGSSHLRAHIQSPSLAAQPPSIGVVIGGNFKRNFKRFNTGIKMKSWYGGSPQYIGGIRMFQESPGLGTHLDRDRNEVLVWRLTSGYSACHNFKRFNTGIEMKSWSGGSPQAIVPATISRGIEMKSWSGGSPPPMRQNPQEFQELQHRDRNEKSWYGGSPHPIVR
ncbi:hypothetical protein B0H16DRAFT_1469935 [Mycena metata]|uniref:Uncharacterized protein n=1 Tax=Mycena metata TaxID=1033252 RepID=A0AAD7MRG1_9AGAR|nr:hypothetical protein B0H16DRAFT_1469935 [Mycena metata]